MENLVEKELYLYSSSIFFILGATVGFDLRVRFDDKNPNIKRLEVIK
jgi:hypothetical protein